MNHQADRSTPKCLAFVPVGRRGEEGGAGTNLGQMKHMSLASFSSSFSWQSFMGGFNEGGTATMA